ncbi:hypothetical protein WQQ_23260 [Hydrocarboniphaga effusa AP103]|uniref:Uncharacterized protein n=1 Tax=Hydrocarboniphaga effusa AP103 TaxID=1172194 RepID=I7ZJS7_9GAMM|nr:hypothetical protein WQQ_23260 [Hydrocarboniphaga effusa AP103]
MWTPGRVFLCGRWPFPVYPQRDWAEFANALYSGFDANPPHIPC